MINLIKIKIFLFKRNLFFNNHIINRFFNKYPLNYNYLPTLINKNKILFFPKY